MKRRLIIGMTGLVVLAVGLEYQKPWLTAWKVNCQTFTLSEIVLNHERLKVPSGKPIIRHA